MQRSVNDPTMVEILRRHFEPTLEMLRRAIRACPDEYWDAREEGTPFWQYAYHTLFWLDLWLSDSPEAFQAPSFHRRDALFESGEAPPPPLTREQLEGYAEQLYRKCATLFDRLTPDTLTHESEFFEKRWTVGDRILTQLRHIQHHVGHMNGLLSRRSGQGPGWLGYNE